MDPESEYEPFRKRTVASMCMKYEKNAQSENTLPITSIMIHEGILRYFDYQYRVTQKN